MFKCDMLGKYLIFLCVVVFLSSCVIAEKVFLQAFTHYQILQVEENQVPTPNL